MSHSHSLNRKSTKIHLKFAYNRINFFFLSLRYNFLSFKIRTALCNNTFLWTQIYSGWVVNTIDSKDHPCLNIKPLPGVENQFSGESTIAKRTMSFCI